jgi:3-mercaptopropionate dioxygenase
MFPTTIQPVGQLVAGVRPAIELEEVFDADVNLIGHAESTVGDVNGFAPPRDIHRVQNTSDEVANYDLPSER